MMRRTIGLALATLALTVTSACGGSSSDDDSSSDTKTSSTPSASSPTSAAPTATTPAPPVESVDPKKRPTTEQLTATLKNAGLTDKQATCFSKQLEESSLSDELLAALVNRDGSYKPSEKETAAYQKIAQDAATTCS